MSRVTDALDALLGTPSFRGGVVRSRSGVYTNGDGLDHDLSLDSLVPRNTDADVDPCSRHRHGKLKDEKRCHGCGRTRNEIAIDEGP